MRLGNGEHDVWTVGARNLRDDGRFGKASKRGPSSAKSSLRDKMPCPVSKSSDRERVLGASVEQLLGHQSRRVNRRHR